MVLDKSISLFKEGIEEVILIEFKRLKKPEKIGHFGVLICTLCQGQRKKTKQLEADFCILQESAYLNSIDI